MEIVIRFPATQDRKLFLSESYY